MLAEKRGGANQWKENAALNALEKSGFLVFEDMGENIEVPLDYRRNPDVAVLVADQDESTLINTEILTSAVYDVAQIVVPVTWTMAEEMKNSSTTQKISLTRQKLENAIGSHDDELEIRIFTSSSAGGTEVNGLNDLITTATTGTIGGIDSSVETFWANKAEQYVDGSDIEAAATELFNACAKGSGSGLQPTMVLSGPDTQALYESQLQALQRFTDSDSADGGFKTLMFKGAKWIFSHKGHATSAYFVNPKNYKCVVAKNYFRHKGDTNDVPGQPASYFLIYSGLQNITDNRSRLGRLYV